MTTVLLEFVLTSINLLAAHYTKKNGGNPAFNYFVAGLCFAFGLSALFKLL
jgi:hypothetical protein